MEKSIETAAFELQPFGIDLKAYLLSQDKPLVYSEQGLGGCTDNSKVAPDLDYVRIHPFAGSHPNYSGSLDPWKVRLSEHAVMEPVCIKMGIMLMFAHRR